MKASARILLACFRQAELAALLAFDLDLATSSHPPQLLGYVLASERCLEVALGSARLYFGAAAA